ncbi:MAG: serine/threonine-protein kinase, partial [Planctomycetota bacterium]
MNQRNNGFLANGHPNAEMLEAFSSGRLEEVQLKEIEDHLGECSACRQTLREVSENPDLFTDELVAAVRSTNHVTDAAAWRTPRTIGRFQIHEPIGQGGYGVVLAAYDPQLRRDVAIKIPRLGSFLTPELRERFLGEAQAAAALDHSNIVPVYEAGESDGVCFIASARCRGLNLAEWIKQTPHPVDCEISAQLVASLADAVHHAHSRGVLHRDLKP